MRIINLVNDLNYLEGKRYGEKQEYKEVKKEHKTEENSGDVHGGKNRKARKTSRHQEDPKVRGDEAGILPEV